MDINTIESNIRKEAATVLWRVVLFIVYYIALILIGLGLFAAAFGVTWFLIQMLSEVSHINGRVVIWVFIAWLAMWWFCIQIAWYLIKPLFTFHSSRDENRVEVTRNDCSELFALIDDVAKSTGNKMPKHVYLSAEVNACVFYNSTSIWAIFLPTRKNLMVGLGLLQGMNKDEVKAILGHEFGHFSQQTMKVGSISYRLLLIIRDMIEEAQEQQRSAALSRASDEGWEKFFHLASGPISFITRKTIDFYNYIEKRNRSLSRLMEFEADAVACRTVGAKPFISSLCKLPVLSERYSLYENIIADLLSQKQYIKEYWSGYEFVDMMIAKDQQLHLSCNDILDSEIGDNSHNPSKVKIIDGWNTHPSTDERIENARQFLDQERAIDTADARMLVPMNTMDSVGRMRQEFIATNLQEPIAWRNIKVISLDDFKTWLEKEFKENRVPHFLLPFVNKNVVSFSFPSKEELFEQIETPFNTENREMLLEFRQGLADWQTLNQLNSEDSGVKQLLYNDNEISDCSIAIERHKAYLEPYFNRIKNLDIEIYKYLWHRAKNKTNLNVIYWAMFYGNDGISSMSDIMDTVNAIREQAQFYRTHGQGFSLRSDVQTQLTQDFWTFMRSFDYKTVSNICGNWKNEDDSTVNQSLNKWYDFAAQKNIPYISTSDLFEMIDNVYSLLNHLYNLGRSQWTQRVINAYYNIEEEEEPEPEPIVYEDIWDESLEIISEGEQIRYKIVDHISKLDKGQSAYAADIFGEDTMSIDEYTEFLKVTNSMVAPSSFSSKEEMDKAIAEQEIDPDVSMMKKIGYAYLLGNIVEQDFVKSTKWFMKAAEQNDAEALDRVGGAYFHGSGVEQNLAIGVEYYKKSIVVDGFSEALLDLGLAYLRGEGVPINPSHGYALMIRAAKQGNALAQYNMGYLYHNGVGVDPDIKEAIRWYRLSAKQGYEHAIECLKELQEKDDVN